MTTKHLVIYVSHPLVPTDAEIRSIGVPSDGATEYTLREFATKANIDRAMRWLAWLRRSFPETTFIAPWIASVLAYGDEKYVAAFEMGGRDSLAVIERCDGIVLCGSRISAGVGLLGERCRVWKLTCEKSPEPPEKMRPHRAFASWAIAYEAA